MSTDIQQRIYGFLDGSKLDYEVMACDPELADTAVFCERYGIPLENALENSSAGLRVTRTPVSEQLRRTIIEVENGFSILFQQAARLEPPVAQRPAASAAFVGEAKA